MFNQPFFAQQTITQFYRMDDYAKQIESEIKKLNGLLKAYRRGNKAAMKGIKAELQYLKATNEAMNENIVEMQNTGLIQCIISGKILDLKREISITIEKAEKILEE